MTSDFARQFGNKYQFAAIIILPSTRRFNIWQGLGGF
jgi:hypothetical protein